MSLAAAIPWQPEDRVDPRIGTAGGGQTFPATGVPFGMTQWTPQTRTGKVKCVAPYYAGHKKIEGFRGSHFMSGSCKSDYGRMTMMPMSGALRLGDAERG
jgi:putative alpha-1,2-mannosidase